MKFISFYYIMPRCYTYVISSSRFINKETILLKYYNIYVIYKNLARYLKIILLNCQNNYVQFILQRRINIVKNFDMQAT